METIQRIIKGCREKAPKYQRLFYDRFLGFASRVVFRYIYHYERAVDVVTDGFVKALVHFDAFDYSREASAEKQVMGWLKQIMIHCAIDDLRRQHMLPEIGGIPGDVWEVPDKSGEADQLVLYKDLVSVIRELPPRYRLVFNLYVLDGYNHSQVADLLKIPVSTSRANLARARVLLRDAITKMEETKTCSI